MGSKQSKPTIDTTLKKDSAEAVVTKKENITKLPMDHPQVTRTADGECPYKNPLKSIGRFVGIGRKKESEDPAAKNTKEETASPTSAQSESLCPVKSNATSSSTKPTKSECPVKQSNANSSGTRSGVGVQYNVYSQPIDPTNNMPSVANQLPSPMQNEELSTERIKSSIPKGGTDGGTWTYPSPQMFYNSLSRKNKLGDTEESDIESVVAIHNNMNEKTWAKVMEWEEVLCPDGNKDGGSKLSKFLGRPSDLSPKARFKNMIFGHPLPFDRHDWTIVRPDGTEVRYIIDYYVDETKASEKENSGMPNMHDRDAIKSILVDVRPAADNVENVLGRALTMPYSRRFENAKFEPMPIIPNSELKNQITESEKVWDNIQQSVAVSKGTGTTVAKEKSMVLKQEDIPDDQKEDNNSISISDEEARAVAKSFVTMLDNCRSGQEMMDKCSNDEECAQASLSLTMCLAKVVCPIQQDAVASALNADGFDSNDEKAVEAYNARFEKALENMTICVTAKSQKAALARDQYPELFEETKR